MKQNRLLWTKNMDTVILAGGFATRLWPLTKDKPKPLLPLGDKPIIDYLINDLINEERIDKIYLSINKRFKQDFQEYINKKNYNNGIELVIEDTEKEEEKLGALGALNQVINKKNIKNQLLVIAGDNYVSFNISDFLDYFTKKQGTCLAAYKVPKEEASSFGVLNIDGEEVIDFEEKPQEPKSNLISIAFYCFSKKAIKKLNKYIKEGENPDAPGYFIQWLINKEKVHAYPFNGKWFDIGTPMGYLEANKALLEGENTVINSEINNESNIKNTYIENSKIKKSKLNNCIVLNNSEIKNCELKNVIIEDKTLKNQTKSNEVIK